MQGCMRSGEDPRDRPPPHAQGATAQLAKIGALEEYGAGVWTHEHRETTRERRLSRAAFTDHPERLAPLERQGDTCKRRPPFFSVPAKPAKRRLGAVRFAEILRYENGLSHA